MDGVYAWVISSSLQSTWLPGISFQKQSFASTHCFGWLAGVIQEHDKRDKYQILSLKDLGLKKLEVQGLVTNIYAVHNFYLFDLASFVNWNLVSS